MSGKYVMNFENGKLHTLSCRCVPDMVDYHVSVDVEKLLTIYSGKTSYCDVCLKNDEKAQKLVDAHNQKC